MKALILCEYSGIVRNEFTKRGHLAFSVDLLPSLIPINHLQQDIKDIPLESVSYFDLVIAFPPCTHLCSSGARWFKDKAKEQEKALELVKWIMNLPVKYLCIENPIGVISTKIRKPDQIIQPWQFGHGETKSTCLWLKVLPKLVPTNIVDGREQRIWRMSRTKDRGLKRSLTYTGIAAAMAEQWGDYIEGKEHGR